MTRLCICGLLVTQLNGCGFLTAPIGLASAEVASAGVRLTDYSLEQGGKAAQYSLEQGGVAARYGLEQGQKAATAVRRGVVQGVALGRELLQVGPPANPPKEKPVTDSSISRSPLLAQ